MRGYCDAARSKLLGDGDSTEGCLPTERAAANRHDTADHSAYHPATDAKAGETENTGPEPGKYNPAQSKSAKAERGNRYATGGEERTNSQIIGDGDPRFDG